MTIWSFNFNNLLETNIFSQQCVASWYNNLPANCEIKIIDESSPLFKELLNASITARILKEKELWAKLYDYCRFHFLYRFGGIVMELDQYIYSTCKSLVLPEEYNWTACERSKNFCVTWSPQYWMKGDPSLKKIIDIYDTKIPKMPSKSITHDALYEGNWTEVPTLAMYNLPYLHVPSPYSSSKIGIGVGNKPIEYIYSDNSLTINIPVAYTTSNIRYWYEPTIINIDNIPEIKELISRNFFKYEVISCFYDPKHWIL